MNLVLLDIGGTKTRVAISHDGTSFDEPVIFDTPKDFRSGIEKIVATVREIVDDESIDVIAGGIAGVLSRDRSTFIEGPHLPGWSGRNISTLIGNALDSTCYLENDTAVVGLGEYAHGAGSDLALAPGVSPEIFAYITVSTGVGGVRIVNGTIDVAAYTFEPGHQMIDVGGGLRGGVIGYGPDLEGYISGHAIEERYGKKPFQITDDKVWDEEARVLAAGLYNSIVHWSPDVVVLGGSMFKHPGIPIDRVRHYLAGMLHVYPAIPRLLPAKLADIGGIWGALELAKQKMQKVKN